MAWRKATAKQKTGRVIRIPNRWGRPETGSWAVPMLADIASVFSSPMVIADGLKGMEKSGMETCIDEIARYGILVSAALSLLGSMGERTP